MRRRDQQGGTKKKKKGVCGEGEHLACYLYPKSSKSLQESNTQLWLLTSCAPQAELGGGIISGSLAVFEHQPRDLLGPQSLSPVRVVYSGMMQLCSKTTHRNTLCYPLQTRSLLDITGPRFEAGIWELVSAAGKGPAWTVRVQP